MRTLLGASVSSPLELWLSLFEVFCRPAPSAAMTQRGQSSPISSGEGSPTEHLLTYLSNHPGDSFVCILRVSFLQHSKPAAEKKSLHFKPPVHKSSKLHLKSCSGTWQGIRWIWRWAWAMRLQEGTTPTSCAVVVTGHTTLACSGKIKEEEIQAHGVQE